MILTFLYVIATSIQSRRVLFLKAHLRHLFHGSATNYPTIVFFNKTELISCKESKCSVPDEDETGQDSMTSHQCTNKNDARLGELLWYHGDMRLCTIYPQQTINVSGWLSYQYGRTLFPLYANNHSRSCLQPEYKIYILIEADLESYKPIALTNATKIEDYGLIVAWTTNRNINLIVESDLDTVAKLLIAAMEGQCYINSGLLLKRIETVLISGKPCLYNNDLLNPPPDKRFVRKADWDAHVEKLRRLSNTARLASEECKPLQLDDLSGVVVYPENTASDTEIELMERAPSYETLDSESRSRVSTPASLNINIQHQDEKLSQSTTHPLPDNSGSLQSVATSGAKSLDHLDNFDEMCDVEKSNNESSTNIKIPSEPSAPNYERKDSSGYAICPQSTSKNSMAEVIKKLQSKTAKPLNVLIYADSIVALNNVKSVLEEALGADKYAISPLTLEEGRTDSWMESAALVVVCGNVGGEIGSQIVEYILGGGKLLALCSDILHILLPSFKTAEVRENELVHCSYGKWKHVRMMHHIFCYQASPVRTKFSQDHEDAKISSLNPPTSTNVQDKRGKMHSFAVKVLGTEETWHTPSILLASLPGSSGKVVFSQIHLEVDPMEYELDESKFNALKESNAARLEIFNDLLTAHLGIEVNTLSKPVLKYTSAFFLGRHELKLQMLEELKEIMQPNDTLKMAKLEIQFCRGSATVRPPSSSFLPIMLHHCPGNFSTTEYFENLSTRELGRLVIYADMMTSSMDVVNGHRLQHGLVVIPCQQTKGLGRSKNVWLSPKGCAMFSVQLHVRTNSQLGSHISILQYIVGVAIVSAVNSLPGYEDIDLRLKWPNDIYIGNVVKIGGVIVHSLSTSDLIVCNVGVGVNLANEKPTCCLNDVIKLYNETYKKNLKLISAEQYFAIVFNALEMWLDKVQTGKMDAFFDIYYKYWLHTDSNVTIISAPGTSEKVKILGIDSFGFLRVRGENGKTVTLHPDGNRFDYFKGLIISK